MRSGASLQSLINWSAPQAGRTPYKNTLNRETAPRSAADIGSERKSGEAEQEATLLLNCCMCASFSFTCCDTKPPGAICSCCFISHSNRQGHKDSANKDSGKQAVGAEPSCQTEATFETFYPRFQATNSKMRFNSGMLFLLINVRSAQ